MTSAHFTSVKANSYHADPHLRCCAFSQCVQHPFYQWVNAGEAGGKAHASLQALGGRCAAGSSGFLWELTLGQQLYHRFFLCLSRVLSVVKFQNPKPVCPANKLRRTRFFQECFNWRVYWSQHHLNHFCFFTALHELEKFIRKNRRASKSKL